MKFLGSIAVSLLSLGASTVLASSWGFEDATITVQAKGAGVGGGGLKEKLSTASELSKEVTLTAADTLKIILTTIDGKTAKRPHQAFLTLQEPKTGLEESFPFSLKESGKGRVELTQKDLPFQFLAAETPLSAKLVIGSFGSSTAFNSKVFSLSISRDPTAPFPIPEAPLRYGSLAEIHHIFRDDPRSPPRIISAFFALAVLATLPVLLGSWLYLGANFSQLHKALGAAPVSHALFVGSIAAMEGIFFLYYTSWNLFQTLPAAAVIGIVTFLSGSKALSEVQERRLAGLR